MTEEEIRKLYKAKLEARTEDILNLMASMKMTSEEAAAALRISDDDRVFILKGLSDPTGYNKFRKDRIFKDKLNNIIQSFDLNKLKDENAAKEWIGWPYEAAKEDKVIERIFKLIEETGADIEDVSYEDDRILELFEVDGYRKCAPECVDLPEFRQEYVQEQVMIQRPECFDGLVNVIYMSHCGDNRHKKEEFIPFMVLIWILAWFKVYYPAEYYKRVDDFEAFRDHMAPGYSRVQTAILERYVRNIEVRNNLDRIYLDVTELLKVIDNSYVDIHEKLEGVRMMKAELEYLKAVHPIKSLGPKDERDYDPAAYVLAMEKLYMNIIDLLSGRNKERCIFIAHYAWIKNSVYDSHRMVSDVLDVEEEPGYEIFDSMDEAIGYLKKYHDPKDDIEEFDIDVITIPIDADVSHKEPLSVVIHYDGKNINTFRLYYKDDGRYLGLTDDEAELVGEVTDLSDVRYEKLPYGYGSFIKVQTPLMKEPFVGQLYAHMDGCHCWYSFLYEQDDFCDADFIDLSYHTMNCSDLDYCTWDWISEATQEEVDEFRRKKVESKNQES